MCRLLKNRKTEIVFALAILLLVAFTAGCRQRYWYRVKVDMLGSFYPKEKTIHLTVTNMSKKYLSRMFENNMRMYCLQRLKKYGYIETTRDTADYNFTLMFWVDSFHVKGIWYMPIELRTYTPYDYSHSIYQLTIQYDLRFFKDNVHFWDFKNQIYFFNNENKDLRRSKSMMRYSLRQLPD
ncbi:MAG: hypothetical protein ACHQK8_06700 [Bacteroidia bacterium]